MKFTQKNKLINKTNKKPTNGKLGSDRTVRNQRNLLQQKRANSLQSQNKSKNKKRVNHEQEINENYANNQNDFEDQVQGMDANVHIGRLNDGKRGNKQYNDLMQESGKGFRRQKNKYFLQSQKYQGKTVNSEVEEEQVEEQDIDFDDQNDFEDDENMLDEDEEENSEEYQNQQDQAQQQDQEDQEQNNQIQQALSELQKKRQSTSKLIQSQLESINLQDKKDISQVIKSKSKSTEQEYQEALGLKKLLDVYDNLVEVRYGQQKQLQDIKKYPKMNEQQDMPKYTPMSHQLFTLSRQLQNEVITNLSESLKIYKKLAKKTICSTVNNQKDSENEQQMDEQTADDLEQMIMTERQNHQSQEDGLNPCRLNVDKIYNLVKSTISKQTSLVQKQLIKWSQKTSFLSSNSSTHLSSLLMQTPVGQAKKVLSNWQRMANKCQQKRGQQLFKILFEPEDNIHAMSDVQIYDDYDLFIELEKYYLEKVNDQNEDNEFLSSATMKYLKNKQANQLNHERKQKDVDRKASKNRKIRYNVHTKLLNFMPAVQENVIETRDQIVKNMFNCNARVNEEAGEGNSFRARQQFNEEQLIEVQ